MRLFPVNSHEVELTSTNIIKMLTLVNITWKLEVVITFVFLSILL